jgi:electron transfer flavoprotein beta subunit
MNGKGLEVVVLVSPVHDCLNPVTIEPGGKKIDHSSLRLILNPYDAFALEEALQLRSVVPDTRIRVMTLASADAEAVIRECLAVGVDEAIRIWDHRMEGSDPHATASVLAAALQKRPFDLVLCGWRRADLEHGQLGPILAEFLELPQVTGARKILPGEDGKHILLDKRIPGYLTKISCPLPAVITLEKGQVLRYPRHADRRRARKARITTLGLESIGLTEEVVGPSGSITRVERFTPPKPARRSAMASATGTMTAAARLQRIMGGGVQEKKDSKIWECHDEGSVRKVAEHMIKEKMIIL